MTDEEIISADVADIDESSVEHLRQARQQLKSEIAKLVVGQDTVVDSLLTVMLCRGHALIIGVPGLGKTLMARTIAKTLAEHPSTPGSVVVHKSPLWDRSVFWCILLGLLGVEWTLRRRYGVG